APQDETTLIGAKRCYLITCKTGSWPLLARFTPQFVVCRPAASVQFDGMRVFRQTDPYSPKSDSHVIEERSANGSADQALAVDPALYARVTGPPPNRRAYSGPRRRLHAYGLVSMWAWTC